MSLGPATQAPHDVLRSDVVLCAGEDAGEFEAALYAAGPAPRQLHTYRGTTFWTHGDRLAVCTGIGTGHLEPVLWELLAPGVVERMVLVGTAGTLPGAKLATMTPFLVDPALPGLSVLGAGEPLRPTLDLGLPGVACVSTDLFYGFSPEPPYPVEDAVRDAFERRQGRPALVDMESHAFYWLTARMAPSVQYGAVKVAANPVTDLHALADASKEALRIAVTAAWG